MADSVSGANSQASGATGSVGEYTTKGFEGSIKQATDIATEEAMAIIQSRVAAGDEDHRRALNQLTVQALQNAVTTADMVGKQAVRHADVAIDRTWNVDEQGYTVAEILRDNTFKDALAAAVAAAVAAVVQPKAA